MHCVAVETNRVAAKEADEGGTTDDPRDVVAEVETPAVCAGGGAGSSDTRPAE